MLWMQCPMEAHWKILTLHGSDKVRIDVVDTGVGIPPEDLNRLFEPFFTTKSQGTGLGLANAKRVLEQHGGDIRSKSIVGHGTTMSLWLPISSDFSPSDFKKIGE